ncbi:MAG: F0F1 ATP synthase subunit gamma [Acidimicrobiales bacterium]
MASGKERELRRRIRSVQSTKKITRAMELIAASRIVKAQQAVVAARPYSEQITEVISHLASGAGAVQGQSLFTARDPVRRVGFIALTADRGLAGGYNATVIRTTERALKQVVEAGQAYSLVLVGRKAQAYFRYRHYDIDAAFTGMSDRPTYEDARAIAAAVTGRFEAGEVDQVELVYTQFLSLSTQRVTTRRLMPLSADALVAAGSGAGAGHAGPAADYEFEPSAAAILESIVPRYVEARIFSALLEAAASEHAARQRAMKSATDNAEELIKVLERVANRARQEAITTEIMEIVGGAEALRQATQGGADLLPDTLSRTDVLPDSLDFRR